MAEIHITGAQTGIFCACIQKLQILESNIRFKATSEEQAVFKAAVEFSV